MHTLLAKYIRDTITVSDEELDTILSCFHPLQPAKNELLVSEGHIAQRMYFVVSGYLRVYFIREDGFEATRYIAFENNFATALVSFIAQSPSQEFIQALQPGELLYIGRNDFYRLLDTVPAWEKFYRSYLEYAYTVNTNKLMSFMVEEATERYKKLLEIKPHVVQRLPNKTVASYLNISQETLSRIKAKL
jgi:CRP-like cAMP-binding protein